MLRSRVVLLLVLFTLTSSPSSASGLFEDRDSVPAQPDVRWDLSSLAPVVASRIHLTADSVPAFPHEDPSLRNPRKWPAALTIAGLRCSLRVQEIRIGPLLSIENVRSFADVRPGFGYGMLYETSRGDGRVERYGPSYFWDSNGWLHERDYQSPDTLRSVADTYQYFKSGKLIRYCHRNDSRHPGKPDPEGPYEWFDELFALGGQLVACGYSKTDGAGVRTTACYILGKSASHSEFGDWKVAYLRRALP